LSDGVGIVGGTTYYYVVRAVDGINGFEEPNIVEKSGVASGPPVSTSWSDSFEGAQSGGGFDQPGWTKSSLSGSTNWAWSTARFKDGTHSWFAQDVSTMNDKVLVSPPFGVGPNTTLAFFHTWQFEGTVLQCYDAATLEVTTNGGASWTVVPVGDFVAGAYNGTANAGNPLAGKRAWCAGTLGALVGVTVNPDRREPRQQGRPDPLARRGRHRHVVAGLVRGRDAVERRSAAPQRGRRRSHRRQQRPVCEGGTLN
jgi:hypothetical protein